MSDAVYCDDVGFFYFYFVALGLSALGHDVVFYFL